MALTEVNSLGLKNSEVKTADIADENVTLAKLEHGTSGNNGKFLRANNGADPTWETVDTSIADDSIVEAKLDVHNAPSTGQYLKYTSNGMEWATAQTGTDPNAMPKAGGTFTGDVTFDNQSDAGKDIIWDESDDALEFADDTKAVFGTGSDLTLQHTSGNSRITHGGAGNLIVEVTTTDSDLYLRAEDKVYIQPNNGDDGIICNAGGSTDIYHNNVKKLWTESWGVNIDGNLALGDSEILIFGGSDDFKIYHGGTNTYLDNNTGNLIIRNNVNADVGGDIHIMTHDNEYGIIIEHDGACTLLHDNATKLVTTSGGISVTGNVVASNDIEIPNDSGKIKLGTGTDLSIYHNGSDSYIKDSGTGHLKIDGSRVILRNVANDDPMVDCTGGGGVEMYYNGTKHFEIDSSGVVVCAGSQEVTESSYAGSFTSSSGSTPVGISLSPTGATNQQVSCNSYGYEVNVINNISGSGHSAAVHQYRTVNGTEGTLQGDSSGLSISNNSDYRKKERITDLTGSLEVIDSLRPRQYYYRAGFGKPTRAHAGFIAHELESTDLPHLTTGVKDAVVTQEDKNNGLHSGLSVGDPVYQTVAYSNNELITHLVNAIKELKTKVTALEST